MLLRELSLFILTFRGHIQLRVLTNNSIQMSKQQQEFFRLLVVRAAASLCDRNSLES